ncbi:MAG: multifunctional CCA tRNA nucleotidyl transferase/2'3'-cyclic phosphodiesterase/2'nucleotidase/phosphatase [Gammaproteobacteria bacterium]|jgi:tRNA nucleotidyltransferase (CCA-adding enzyme)
MRVYLVGGAVRDRLLELPVREKDWVVVGASPQEMLELGYKPVGKDFPVFLHPETGEEYALARTERKTGPGYKGFAFHASPEVTLEQDLKRRDLTINAMAETSDGRLIDPYHGRDDLDNGLLRHVSPAFAEDPVRILRVARFAAQLGKWGFKVAHGTNALMRRMVENGEVDHLVPERVWGELARALATDTPQRFFTMLAGCGALAALFPEIAREYGEQASHRHIESMPALQALEKGAARSADPRVRFAVLVRALGQDLDADQRLAQAEALCERYRAPKEFLWLARHAIRHETEVQSDDPEKLFVLMESAGGFRDARRWKQLLEVYVAAGLIDSARAACLERARASAARVTAAAVEKPGLSGRELGAAIRQRRIEVIRDAGCGSA